MKTRQTITAMAMAASAALLSISSPASASVVATTSFEAADGFPDLGTTQDQYGPDQNGFNQPPSAGLNVAGYTFSGYSGIISNPTLFNLFPDTPYGKQAAFLQGFASAGGSIDWTVSGLTVGNEYTLSFYDVAATPEGGDPFAVSFSGATGGGSFSPTNATQYLVNDVDFWATNTVVSIDFDGSTSGGNILTAIDNLAVADAVVPEPSTVSLFGAALFSLAGFIMYRRRKQSGADLAA